MFKGLLVITGQLFAVVFGLASGMYVTRYCIGWADGLLSSVSTLVLGLAITTAAFISAIFIAWLPFM